MIVHEATRTSGFGAELSALVQERCFYALEAPIERVTGFDTPYPHSLEWAYFPGPVRIGEAIKKILRDCGIWRASLSTCPISAKAFRRRRSSTGMWRWTTSSKRISRLRSE